MLNILQTLKHSLIKAAYPRGGEGKLRSGILNVEKEFILDTREEEDY